ncbi:MAG TPA: hypothetical protein VGV61_12900 [Thermoanaerobaculia bacterium]|nr:hypothetical protein [Thermoanaerobaculia bacterium]
MRVPPILRLLVLAVAVALAGGAHAAAAHPTAELRGTLQLLQDGRPVNEGVDQAIVFFTPTKKAAAGQGAAAATKAAADDPLPEMTTVHKEFRPRLLVVAVGGKVRFPNADPILHNAFSVSGANAFDVGLYAKGPGKEVTFKEPGLVRVFCNVHMSMAAYVLVLDTPYSTSPDNRGGFTLSGLPAGPGTLSVWHERGEMQRQAVTLPVTAPLRVALPVTKPRVPRHLNKFGKAYSTDSAYR